MTEPCDLTAVEARRMIGAKQLAPSELLESCIARTEAVDHAVNAMVIRDFATARGVARAADAAVMRGDDLPPLHGLPIGIKDLESTKGLLTTFGSPLLRDNIPAEDERVVAAVRRAGANTIELVDITIVAPSHGCNPQMRTSLHQSGCVAEDACAHG